MTKIVLCRIGFPGHIMREITITPPLTEEELKIMAQNSDAVFERSRANPNAIGMWPKLVQPVVTRED
jgi:hypothetical protein